MSLVTASAATLATALAALKPGDTLRLQGAFETLGRPKAARLQGVTIDAAGATIGGLFYPAGAVTGLTLKGGTWAGVRLDKAERISVEGATFQGPAEAADGGGLSVVDGRGITVNGAVFDSFKTGIGLGRVTGFEIRDCGFSRMRSDGITIGESRQGTVMDNIFHGTRITSSEHPDAVQLFSRPTSAPTADIVITRNLVVGMTQGLTGFNHVRDGVDDGGFDRIVIAENRLYVGYPNAIALVDARRSVIRGNEVSTYPGATYRASINATRCTELTRSGNIVRAGAGKAPVVDPDWVDGLAEARASIASLQDMNQRLAQQRDQYKAGADALAACLAQIAELAVRPGAARPSPV